MFWNINKTKIPSQMPKANPLIPKQKVPDYIMVTGHFENESRPRLVTYVNSAGMSLKIIYPETLGDPWNKIFHLVLLNLFLELYSVYNIMSSDEREIKLKN